ncbi:MAG: Na(+)-translocating NADH-quinone reductase subunit C [Pseudomonadota bacterium]
MADKRETVGRTLVVAAVASLFCSALVTTAAIVLKPLQDQNSLLNRQENILAVAGLLDPEQPIDAQFGAIETRIVNLAAGDYVDDVDPQVFDAARAASDPTQSTVIPAERDIAKVGRRENLAPVYIVRDGDDVTSVILPIRGAGLWSTMKGFLALEPDGKTVYGLRFNEHGETPGLGDQIESERWLALWEGKVVIDAAGEPQIEVIRGRVPRDVASNDPPQAGDPAMQVDGMSGATLTGAGVTTTLRFWLGPDGFGPYLKKHWLEAT